MGHRKRSATQRSEGIEDILASVSLSLPSSPRSSFLILSPSPSAKSTLTNSQSLMLLRPPLLLLRPLLKSSNKDAAEAGQRGQKIRTREIRPVYRQIRIR
jgi:hypothetical protein